MKEQEENPSIEPAAEATVCACLNQFHWDTCSSKIITFLLRKCGQIDLNWSHVIFGHIGIH